MGWLIFIFFFYLYFKFIFLKKSTIKKIIKLERNVLSTKDKYNYLQVINFWDIFVKYNALVKSFIESFPHDIILLINLAIKFLVSYLKVFMFKNYINLYRFYCSIGDSINYESANGEYIYNYYLNSIVQDRKVILDSDIKAKSPEHILFIYIMIFIFGQNFFKLSYIKFKTILKNCIIFNINIFYRCIIFLAYLVLVVSVFLINTIYFLFKLFMFILWFFFSIFTIIFWYFFYYFNKIFFVRKIDMFLSNLLIKLLSLFILIIKKFI